MAKILLRLIGILIALYIGYGLITQTNLSATPNIVIDASKGNKVYSMKVEVEKPALYRVEFEIFSDIVHAQDRFGYPQKRRTIKVYNYAMSNNADLPMSFMVTVENQQTKEDIFNDIVVYPHTAATGGGRYATLFQDYLEEGEYAIKVEVLKADPKLADFFTMLTFSERPIK